MVVVVVVQVIDQVELGVIYMVFVGQYGIVDMGQQYVGEDQVVIGVFCWIWFDFCYFVFEGYCCCGDLWWCYVYVGYGRDVDCFDFVYIMGQLGGGGVYGFGLGGVDQVDY